MTTPSIRPIRFSIVPIFLVLAFLAITASFAQQPSAPEVLAEPVDGYRGIWFTLGQFYGPGSGEDEYSKASRTPVFPYGDKYSGGLGTYTAKHTPLAIYAPEVEKTFFVYGGTTGPNKRHLLCMISYYDHRQHRVPRPVVVHDKQGVDDPHDNPSLSIDASGYIWVFVSGRGTRRPGFKYRSRQPFSIDSFERISTEEMTYPQPHFIQGQGFIHLFSKYSGVRELYFETSPDGRTWSEDQKLAGIREPGHTKAGHYQTSANSGDRVGTFFNRHPEGNVDRRTDLYYLQTTDRGATWTTVDLRNLQLPLTDVESPARAVDYASSELNVYLKDMGFDSDGNPVCLHVTSPGCEPGPPNDPRHFCVTRWDGDANQWKTNKICSTDHNYDMGSLYLNDESWSVVIPSQTGPQPYQGGGEMVLWNSNDKGENWVVSRQVTTDSPRNHNYARRPLQASNPFYSFWSDGDPTRLSESHLYFTDSTGTQLYRLPYDMDDDYATPVLIER